jgi:hypothetical protein
VTIQADRTVVDVHSLKGGLYTFQILQSKTEIARGKFEKLE